MSTAKEPVTTKFFFWKLVLFEMARTYFYACCFCFLIAFFSRNDLSVCYDFGVVNKE